MDFNLEPIKRLLTSELYKVQFFGAFYNFYKNSLYLVTSKPPFSISIVEDNEANATGSTKCEWLNKKNLRLNSPFVIRG